MGAIVKKRPVSLRRWVTRRIDRIFSLVTRTLDKFCNATGVDESAVCQFGMLVEIRCDPLVRAGLVPELLRIGNCGGRIVDLLPGLRLIRLKL